MPGVFNTRLSLMTIRNVAVHLMGLSRKLNSSNLPPSDNATLCRANVSLLYIAVMTELKNIF